MLSWQKGIGALMVGLSLLLGGCAVGGGARPVLGLDGQAIDLSDPVERGRAQILTGQYGLAVDGLTQVVTRDPGNARAATLLAVAYGQLKRFDLADRYHALALELDPDSVAALNNWGYSYLVRGDKVRAEDLLERAIAASDGRPIVAANLALARGNDPAARPSVAQTAVAVDPMPSLRLSEHVTLVRPAGRLMRVAPGVQMLLTTGPAPAAVPASPAPTASPPPLPTVADTASAAPTDSRFALFRALFAMMEGEAPPAGSESTVPGELAGASSTLPASPFGFFPEVDDFTTAPTQLADASALAGAVPFQFFPDVDDFTQQ